MVGLCGCASASLRSARSEISAGHYAEAHQKLIAMRSSPNLSDSERREIADELCVTEYKLGAPEYPIAEQEHVCAEAASLGGKESTQTLSGIRQSERTALVQEINQAIADSDLARAEDGIARFQRIPGENSKQIIAWSRQMWTIVGRQDAQSAKMHRGALQSAIAEAMRHYPQVRGMNDQAFARWLRKDLVADQTSLISSIQIKHETMILQLPDQALGLAALNLDKFARANDAMVARCGCNGRTDVAMQSTQIPAYVVRLDPETRRSEVLVLARR
jgi:hypothetical protein